MEKQTDISGTIFKIKRFSIHDGPGIRTAVFLKGCPLNCIWCHSPEGITSDISIWYNRNICIACSRCVQACPENALKLIDGSEPHIEIDRIACKISGECVRICPSNAMQFTGSYVRLSEVYSEIVKDIAFYGNSGGGVTLTGGEPLFQPEFTLEILKFCRKENINTVVETSLFCERIVIEQISEFVDIFIADLKIFDPVQHKMFIGKPNDIIKDNFRYLAESKKEIIVRIPLIKDIIDTRKNKDEVTCFVHDINPEIQIEFIKSNPLAENNYNRLGIPFMLK